MTMFLLYIIKSTICLTLFYLFFVLVMRRSTLFRFNRITLLAGSVVCLLLPLVPVTVSEIQVAQMPMQMLAEILVVPSGADGNVPAVAAEGVEQTVANTGEASRLPLILLGIYLLGACVVSVLTLVSALQVWRLIRHAPYREEGGCRLIVQQRPIRSFSIGRYIVLSEEDYLNSPAVLMHERMHLRNLHSLDSAWFMVIAIVYWFNPVVWLMRMELQAVHEYEADEGVINQGIDATQYQLLLVEKAVGSRLYSIANGFNHSKLKNRINMMLKEKSNGRVRFRLLLSAPVVMGTLFAFARPEVSGNLEELSAVKVSDLSAIVKTEEVKSAEFITPQSLSATSLPEDSIFKGVPEKMPEYPGGMVKLREFLCTNVLYPAEAQNNNRQGRVIVEFVVKKDGGIANPKVVRSVSPELDAEALRVIKLMPKWISGYHKGKPVNSRYTIPVLFRLN